MAECEVPMLCEITEFEPSSNQIKNGKETIHEEVNGEENEKETVDEDSIIDENRTVDGNSVIIDDDDDKREEEVREDSEIEQKGNVDWMNEYPPLVSSSAGRNTPGWLDILKKQHKTSSVGMQDVLKKPHCPIDFKVKSESASSSEVCSIDENRASIKASTCFLVKLPRLDDEVLKEQIRLAKLLLDEKTSSRDATRAILNNITKDNEYAHEVKTARELLKMKRKEIDSHLSIIRVVKKNASSFNDMDSQEAFEQQSEAQEYLKTLKRELDSLKANVLRAETTEQKKKQDGEKKVRELKVRLRVENDACQTAYTRLKTLRAQNQDKYYGHRKEATTAYSKASCKNQVERFVKVWNTNKEFRQDYVKSNAKSTFQRFRTLDGRSLGRDEKPVMMPHVPVVNMVQKETQEELKEEVAEAELEVVQKETREELKEEEVEAKLEVETNEISEAEKLQMEAEKREKKRLKRLRLKERKKAAAAGLLLLSQSEEHHLEENEQVLAVEATEETKKKEGEDELKELQGQIDGDVRSLVDQRVDDDTEVSDENQRVMNEETPEPYVTNLTHEKEKKEEQVEVAHEEITTSDEALTREETAADEVIDQLPEALIEQMRAEIKAQLEAQQRDKNREKNLRKKEKKKQRKNAPPTNGKSFVSVVMIIVLIILILYLTHFYVMDFTSF